MSDHHLTDLPDPPVPADLDLSDEPLPVALAEACAAQFGVPVEDVIAAWIAMGAKVETRA